MSGLAGTVYVVVTRRPSSLASNLHERPMAERAWASLRALARCVPLHGGVSIATQHRLEVGLEGAEELVQYAVRVEREA